MTGVDRSSLVCTDVPKLFVKLFPHNTCHPKHFTDIDTSHTDVGESHLWPQLRLGPIYRSPAAHICPNKLSEHHQGHNDVCARWTKAKSKKSIL